MDKLFSGLSFLSRNVQTYEYQRGKVTLQLDIDIDAFTGDYFRAVQKRMRERFVILAEQDKVARDEIIATMLSEETKRFEEEQAANANPVLELSTDEGAKAAPTAESIAARLNLPPIVNPDDATAFLGAEARSLDTKKEILIEMLRGDLDDLHEDENEGSGVLVSWILPNVDIKCTRDSLRALPPRALEELWEFCSEKAKTVKKSKAATTQMISAITGVGSQESRSNGQSS